MDKGTLSKGPYGIPSLCFKYVFLIKMSKNISQQLDGSSVSLLLSFPLRKYNGLGREAMETITRNN